jgi:hypothetical protein
MKKSGASQGQSASELHSRTKENTMRRFVQTVLLPAVILCFPLEAVAAAALSPVEIQATFGTGKPFSSSTPSGTTYTIILNTDGTASRTPRRSKTPITGTWHVSKDGYCSTWGKSLESCYQVEKDTGRYKVLDRSGSTVAYWTIK